MTKQKMNIHVIVHRDEYWYSHEQSSKHLFEQSFFQTLPEAIEWLASYMFDEWACENRKGRHYCSPEYFINVNGYCTSNVDGFGDEVPQFENETIVAILQGAKARSKVMIDNQIKIEQEKAEAKEKENLERIESAERETLRKLQEKYSV